jgi:hypothetical protein
VILLAAEASGVANEVVTTTSGVIGLAWLIPVLPLLGFLAVLATTRRSATARRTSPSGPRRPPSRSAWPSPPP